MRISQIADHFADRTGHHVRSVPLTAGGGQAGQSGAGDAAFGVCAALGPIDAQHVPLGWQAVSRERYGWLVGAWVVGRGRNGGRSKLIRSSNPGYFLLRCCKRAGLGTVGILHPNATWYLQKPRQSACLSVRMSNTSHGFLGCTKRNVSNIEQHGGGPHLLPSVVAPPRLELPRGQYPYRPP